MIFPDCPDDINCGEELELTDFSHDNNEALLEPSLHEHKKYEGFLESHNLQKKHAESLVIQGSNLLE